MCPWVAIHELVAAGEGSRKSAVKRRQTTPMIRGWLKGRRGKGRDGGREMRKDGVDSGQEGRERGRDRLDGTERRKKTRGSGEGHKEGGRKGETGDHDP